VRPHDLRITTGPAGPAGPAGPGAVPGRITRIVRVGFEVRVEVTTEDQVVTVSLPRSEFLELALGQDTVVAVHEASAQRLPAQTR
jgi:sulfate transport system ATP-binding protein